LSSTYISQLLKLLTCKDPIQIKLRVSFRRLRSMLWGVVAWDITTGCSKISTGCRSCIGQLCTSHHKQLHYNPEFRPTEWYAELYRPLLVTKPKRVLVSPQGDLFHEDISTSFIHQALDVMKCTPQHTYYLLTKRTQRMAQCLTSYEHWPLPNVFIGTSVENQQLFDLRVPILLNIPVHADAYRYISCEPLLGPIKIGESIRSLGWVIYGRERAGRRSRAAKDCWFDALKQECVAAGVPHYHHGTAIQADKLYPEKTPNKTRTTPDSPHDTALAEEVHKLRGSFPSLTQMAKALKVPSRRLSELLRGQNIRNVYRQAIKASLVRWSTENTLIPATA
jgi:protein gp37